MVETKTAEKLDKRKTRKNEAGEQTEQVSGEISFVQAVLGDEIEIPVVDPNSGNGESTTRLKIPSGTQQGTDIRIKGKGMPHLRSTSRGDMYVRVFVTIPTKISKEQKKLLEEYRSIK